MMRFHALGVRARLRFVVYLQQTVGSTRGWCLLRTLTRKRHLGEGEGAMSHQILACSFQQSGNTLPAGALKALRMQQQFAA